MRNRKVLLVGIAGCYTIPLKTNKTFRIAHIGQKEMDEEEYNFKYAHLRMLKSIQEYQKSADKSPAALYPIRIPEDLLYQLVKLHGVEKTDEIIHAIFERGLSLWSEKLYHRAFGSQESLERFIEMVKGRLKE